MYFQRDFFADLNLMSDVQYVIKNVLKEGAECNVFENVAWVMAKTADPSIPNLERWKSSFEVFAIKDIVKEVQSILAVTIGATTQEVKNTKGASNGQQTTVETFLILCKDCGLEHADLETMTIGQCLDYVDAYLELKNPDKKPKVVMASQVNFDSF